LHLGGIGRGGEDLLLIIGGGEAVVTVEEGGAGEDLLLGGRDVTAALEEHLGHHRLDLGPGGGCGDGVGRVAGVLQQRSKEGGKPLDRGALITHKYRGSQQSLREVKPKFIDLIQGEPKNIYKP
jgi:hypothetical protein